MKWPLEPKDVTSRYITESTLLCEGPCLFVSLTAVAGDGGEAAVVYNGLDANAPVVVKVQPAVNMNDGYSPPVPIYLSQGLYLSFEDLINCATIQFVKLQQGE